MSMTGADLMLIGLWGYKTKFQISGDLWEIHVIGEEEILSLEKVGIDAG